MESIFESLNNSQESSGTKVTATNHERDIKSVHIEKRRINNKLNLSLILLTTKLEVAENRLSQLQDHKKPVNTAISDLMKSNNSFQDISNT